MKQVMITGANRGLGYELVKVFHNEGHEVFPVVRSYYSAEELEKEFKSRIYPIIADISTDESSLIIKKYLTRFTHKLDIIINNAGNSGEENKIENISTDEIFQLFNVHCLGAIRATKASLCFLKKSNFPKIINISSRLGSIKMTAEKKFSHLQPSYSYQIAKAAQNMLTTCLNQELYKEGFSTNAIHPGKIKTDQASSDADMTASESAMNIYKCIINIDRKISGLFFQPGITEINW